MTACARQLRDEADLDEALKSGQVLDAGGRLVEQQEPC
jgi:hypothetical protein